MESKLQAENQDLRERLQERVSVGHENLALIKQLRELSERFDDVVADNLNKAAQITKLRQQAADLAKEVDRLAGIILDKEEKS